MSVDWNKFQPVEGSTTDVMWPEKGKELKDGESVEGRYVEKKEGVGKHKSNVYILETEDGKKVGVWGSTVLDTKFASIATGKVVAVEYVGERATKDGSGSYKDFKVGVGIDYVGDSIV